MGVNLICVTHYFLTTLRRNNNCKEIVITNIKTVEDVDIVGYCIRYCNSFVHKPSITVNTTFEIINLMVSNYNN